MHYIEDMLLIGQMDKGEKLYHYTSVDSLINILMNKEFWITKWDYLNDIDEFKVALEVCEEILISENIERNIVYDMVEKMHCEMNKHTSMDYYVLSFSCEKDSQLLWSNYSNNEGVNIEVDFEKFSEKYTDRIMWHGMVNYDKKSQIECMREKFTNEFIGISEFGNIKSLKEIEKIEKEYYDNIISHMSVICELYSMFYKRECFCGEREYRFVFASRTDDKLHFRNKHGVIIPYIVEKIIPIDILNNITIGPTNKSDNAQKGLKEMLRYHKTDIKVSTSNIPLRY